LVILHSHIIVGAGYNEAQDTSASISGGRLSVPTGGAYPPPRRNALLQEIFLQAKNSLLLPLL
jgi:hypothetical protein